MTCGICGRAVWFTPGRQMRCPYCRWRLWMKDKHGKWTTIMQAPR